MTRKQEVKEDRGSRKTRRSGSRGKVISRGWTALWLMYFNTCMECNPAVEDASLSTLTEHLPSLEATSFVCNLWTRLYVALGDPLNNVLLLGL